MNTENTTPVGRPALPLDQRRDKGISLRVSNDEKTIIKKLSEISGASITDTIVAACKDSLSRADSKEKGSVLDRVHKLETRTELILELLGEKVQS